MLVTPERLPKKELKVQNMNKSPPEYCQPELQHNSKQKDDNLFVCHAIRQCACCVFVPLVTLSNFINVCQPLNMPVTAANCQTKI
jgi:hypothetical protein